VFIGLNSGSNNCIRLSVEGNGTGIPKRFEISKLKSLGLRLVSDLVRHELEGEMEISRYKGTCVNVTFREARARQKRESLQ